MANNIYMKIDGVDGEVEATGFQKWIELQSISYGSHAQTEMRTGHGGGRGTGQVSINPLQATKRSDNATIKLWERNVKQDRHPKVTICKVTAGNPPQTYFKIEMEDVLIADFNGSEAGEAGHGAESFTLNFTKIQVHQFPQDKEGAVVKGGSKFGFDLAKATPM